MADKEDKSPTPAADAGTASTPAQLEAPAKPAKQDRNTIVVERRRGFFARWLGRLAALLLILAILLLLGFVGISLVLRSDVPRSLAESVASNALGLELGLGDLDVGWDGDVLIKDLVLRLPSLDASEGEKILEVPRLTAELGPLPKIGLDYLRGGDPQLKRLEIESPTAYATQDDDGQWNLVRALTLMSNASRRSTPPDQQQGSGGLPPLPEVVLTDGTLIVRKNDGQEATLSGFELTGRRDNPLIYTIDGGSPQMLELDGELFPASGKRQQLTLKMLGINEQLRAMFGIPETALHASWQGGLTDGGAEGIIEISTSHVGPAQLEGQLRLSVDDGKATIHPMTQRREGRLEGLIATGVPGVTGPVNLLQGTVVAGAGQVSVDQLLVQLMDGELLVRSASVNAADLAFQLDAAFKNLKPRDKANLSGELTAEAGYDAFGEPTASLGLLASGSMAGTSFERLAVEATAEGPVYHSWKTLDILVTLQDSPLLIRPDEAPTTLPEAEARILVRLDDADAPRIELLDLRSLDPDIVELRGSGVYFTADNAVYQQGEYLVSFEERGFPVKIPRVEERQPLEFGFDLRGRYYRAADPAETVIAPIQITRIFGELADVELDGAGTYVIVADGVEPEPPLSLAVTLTRAALIPSPITPAGREIMAARQALNRPREKGEQAAPGEVTEAEAIQIQPIRGTITSWLEVVGDPASMQFQGTGGILTSNFAVGPFELGTVQSLIELTLTKDYLTVYTPKNKERTNLDWQYAQLFGAHLDFEAVIPFKPEQPGHITLDIQEMQLARVAEAMTLPEVLGTMDGHLDVDLSGLSPSQATARGWFIVHEPGVPRAQLAETITIGRPPDADDPDRRGGVLMENGRISVPVELMQVAQLAPGPVPIEEQRTLSFNFEYDLGQPAQLQVLNLKAEGYPVVLPPAESGGTYIETELSLNSPVILVSFEEATPRVRGDVQALADVATGEAPFDLEQLAQGRLTAEATHARVELEDLHVNLPDIGEITGGGTLELSDLPGLSRIWIHGKQLDLVALADRMDLPEGTQGLLDFSLTVQPGPGERPQGEVLVNLAFSGTDARWRTVEVEQGQVMAYLSRVGRPDDSPSRGQFDFTLMTTERVRLQLADGMIDGYFKLRNRGRVDDLGRPTIFDPLAGAGDDWYVNATLDGAGLSVAQLAPLFYDQEVSGILKFSAIAYGNLNQEPRFGQTEEDLPMFPLSGEVALSVDRGELRDLGLFAKILNFVNVLTRTPQYDSLQARFRLEQGNGYLDSLVAFVDGTEMRMAGRLFDVLDPDATRIDFSGVVLLKPLAQIPLPFFREADDIFSIIQSQATAFRITGPLKDPNPPTLATFNEIGETLRALLIPTMKRR